MEKANLYKVISFIPKTSRLWKPPVLPGRGSALVMKSVFLLDAKLTQKYSTL
jgi:hypothetical protein